MNTTQLVMPQCWHWALPTTFLRWASEVQSNEWCSCCSGRLWMWLLRIFLVTIDERLTFISMFLIPLPSTIWQSPCSYKVSPLMLHLLPDWSQKLCDQSDLLILVNFVFCHSLVAFLAPTEIHCRQAFYSWTHIISMHDTSFMCIFYIEHCILYFHEY